MPEESVVSIAKRIAADAHAGQFRRDGKTPYINHCAAVASRFPDDADAQAVAWLHDVLEDTSVTMRQLVFAQIPMEIVHAVKLLTKRASIPYNVYMRTLKENDLARRVKIADMKSNLADDPTPAQVKRYTDGISYLEEVLCDV